MATNIAALKKALRKMNTSANKSSILWKPTEGENRVRIVPLASNPENPFMEMYFHYNFNGKNYLSPITYDESDPIFEFAKDIRTPEPGQTKVPKEDYFLSKQLEPKVRYYLPIIERNKESEGVKFWGFGSTIYNSLLVIMTNDEEYGDIVDMNDGRDLIINYTAPKKDANGKPMKDATGKTDYGKTSVSISVKQTPVSTDEKVLELVKDQPEIFEIYPKVSYDELKRALEKYLNVTEEDKKEDDPATETKVESTQNTVNETKNDLDVSEIVNTESTDEVKSQFDELFK